MSLVFTMLCFVLICVLFTLQGLMRNTVGMRWEPSSVFTKITNVSHQFSSGKFFVKDAKTWQINVLTSGWSQQVQACAVSDALSSGLRQRRIWLWHLQMCLGRYIPKMFWALNSLGGGANENWSEKQHFFPGSGGSGSGSGSDVFQKEEMGSGANEAGGEWFSLFECFERKKYIKALIQRNLETTTQNPCIRGKTREVRMQQRAPWCSLREPFWSSFKCGQSFVGGKNMRTQSAQLHFFSFFFSLSSEDGVEWGAVGSREWISWWIGSCQPCWTLKTLLPSISRVRFPVVNFDRKCDGTDTKACEACVGDLWTDNRAHQLDNKKEQQL